MKSYDALPMIDDYIMACHTLKDLVVNNAYPLSEKFYIDQGDRLFNKCWKRLMDVENELDKAGNDDVTDTMDNLENYIVAMTMRFNTLYERMIKGREEE